jgi:hypothetical protein
LKFQIASRAGVDLSDSPLASAPLHLVQELASRLCASASRAGVDLSPLASAPLHLVQELTECGIFLLQNMDAMLDAELFFPIDKWHSKSKTRTVDCCIAARKKYQP